MVEPKLGEETEKGEKAKKDKKQAEQPAQPIDPYWLWLQGNMVLKPDDVAVYKKGEDRIVMFVDGTNKSVLNCGLHLSADVLRKINGTEPSPKP